jgi:diguanylate cyclase (GGDEF)-like protein
VAVTLRRQIVRGVGAGLNALGTQRIILIGFALVLALMVILTGLGLSHMVAIKARMVKLVSESNVKAESVYQMRSLSRERFASLGQMVVLHDPFERDDEYMRFQAQAAEFIGARDRLLGGGMGPEEQATWERARELIRRDEQLHAEVLELALADQGEAALALLLRDVRPLEIELLDVFNELVEQYRQANQQALRESTADYREAATYMLALAIMALATGLAIAGGVALRSRYAESELSRQSESAVAAAEQLSWAASHDALTGLANRREMQRRLIELIEDTRAHGARHVLLYVDLDRFKAINDSCGHFAGDEVLRQMARIFLRHVRSGDLVARLGGDEFCIGLVDCQLDKSHQIAEAIRADVEQYRFEWEGRMFQVGASIGLIRIDPAMDVTGVLKSADAACYQAKGRGRNQVCVYGSDAHAAHEIIHPTGAGIQGKSPAA